MAGLLQATGVLPDEGRLREGIRRYKYISPPLSICEELFLNEFWDRVASYFPLYLAPNLITVTGFAFVVLGTLLILFYSPGLTGTAPSWVYVTNAVFLFIYQTCDGSDGKQARRTGSGSALGHLFDHGLDSMVGTLIATWTVDILGQGPNHYLFPAIVGLGQLAFCTSNLVCVHRGYQLFFPIDVQEVEISIMVLSALKGLCPDAFWHRALTIGDFSPGPPPHLHGSKSFAKEVTVWWIIGLISAFGALKSCCQYILNVFAPYHRGEAAPGGGGLHCAVHHVICALLHTFLVMSNLYHVPSIAHPVYLGAVLSFSGLVVNVLLLVVATQPFPPLHWALLVQAAYMLVPHSPILQWLVTVVAVGCYATAVGHAAGAIKRELGIQVFRIKPKPPPPPSAPHPHR